MHCFRITLAILSLVFLNKISSNLWKYKCSRDLANARNYVWLSGGGVCICASLWFLQIWGPQSRNETLMPLWLYWLLYSEDSKLRCFEIYSFLELFHKQFWRSIEYLINCHPRRFEGNAGKGKAYFEPWKCKVFSSTMMRKNCPFPSREDLWNTEVEIPNSAILRFLEIITKLLRSICSSLQSLPEDNFSKNWNFMIIDIIPDTISWLKMNLERYMDSISKAMTNKQHSKNPHSDTLTFIAVWF